MKKLIIAICLAGTPFCWSAIGLAQFGDSTNGREVDATEGGEAPISGDEGYSDEAYSGEGGAGFSMNIPGMGSADDKVARVLPTEDDEIADSLGYLLVVNAEDGLWDNLRLNGIPEDDESAKKLARAIRRCVERTPDTQGDRIVLYESGKIEMKFSAADYNRYGKYLKEVVQRLVDESTERLKQKTEQTVNDLISEAGSEQSPNLKSPESFSLYGLFGKPDVVEEVALNVNDITSAIEHVWKIVIIVDNEWSEHYDIRKIQASENALKALAKSLHEALPEDILPGSQKPLVRCDNVLFVHFDEDGYLSRGQEFELVIKRLSSQVGKAPADNEKNVVDVLLDDDSKGVDGILFVSESPENLGRLMLKSSSGTDNSISLWFQAPSSRLKQLQQESVAAEQRVKKMAAGGGDESLLRELVAEAFVARLRLQREQLVQAEIKLRTSQIKLDQREKNADAIIDDRVDELLGQQTEKN